MNIAATPSVPGGGETSQQRLQSQEVAKLTTIFNKLSQEITDTTDRQRIQVTTDLDIIEDLELNSVAPPDIINEYINEFVIELDAEDDLVYDMGEDEECKLEEEMSVLLPQILHLQHRASQYLTNDHEKSKSLNALRDLSKAFLKQVKVNRGKDSYQSPPTEIILNETVDSMQEPQGEEFLNETVDFVDSMQKPLSE